jgi:hypothetical protein
MGTAWPRGIEYDPWAHADALGLEVVVVDDMRQAVEGHARTLGVRFTQGDLSKVRGLYWHHARRVELVRGLSERAARSTLAHEVQHALAGDLPTADPAQEAEQEARARAGAAWQLVVPTEYAAAELLHAEQGARKLDSIGVTLRVTRAILRDYLTLR